MNILHLIELEWLKYRKNTTFRISLILYFALLPSIAGVLLSFETLPPPLPNPQSFFDFPIIWDFMGYIGNWLAYFLFGFLGVYIISVDSSNKTLRQGVINGLSRKQVISAKLLFILALTLITTFYYILCVFAMANFGTNPFEGSPLLGQEMIILRFFVMSLSYFVFGFLIGLLIRSIGVATMLYFLYVFFIEVILRYVVHLNLFPKSRSMVYYPMNVVEDLTPFPSGSQEVASNSMQLDFNLFLTPTEALIASGIYLLLYVIGIVFILLKRDL